MSVSILLTFDVEDWFQVENLKKCIPFSSWPSCELRVEKNVHKILNLLDSIKLAKPTNLTNPNRLMNHQSSVFDAENGPQPSIVLPRDFSLATDKKGPSLAQPSAPCGPLRSTFFVLGWVAERLPGLIREIQARGHEVASHGYRHQLCEGQSADDLKNDLVKSKKLLEEVTGNPVYGYRAPSFSINHDILKIIKDAGYFYDSSFNAFKLNRRYGQISLTDNGNNGINHQIFDNFYELPISNLKIGNRVVPWGGGGYFRLIPFLLFKRGVERILRKHGAYLFYLHPWEIDYDQPRVAELPLISKFRHYANLDRTYSKLSLVLNCFKEYNFTTLIQYINRQTVQTQGSQQTS